MKLHTIVIRQAARTGTQISWERIMQTIICYLTKKIMMEQQNLTIMIARIWVPRFESKIMTTCQNCSVGSAYTSHPQFLTSLASWHISAEYPVSSSHPEPTNHSPPLHSLPAAPLTKPPPKSLSPWQITTKVTDTRQHTQFSTPHDHQLSSH